MASILYKYTPAELQKLLDTSNGYCDLLRKVGLNGHGSNPETLKKIIQEYNLDTTQNYSWKAHRKEKNGEVCTSNNTRKKEKLLKLPPISREELKGKIRNNSFTSIAKEYRV